MRPLPAILLLLLAAPAAAAPEPIRVETEHYALLAETDRAEAEELGRVLEAAWPQLEAFFGAAPDLDGDERLPVRFFATKESFAAGLRADGIAPPASGGYYHPPNRTAWLWRQPTIYNTRCLLLHEVTHQFHFLARTGNRSLPQNWYVEGLAEHLGRHEWDGETLRIGTLPAQSLSDYAARALAALSEDPGALAAAVEAPSADRALAWALVRWLVMERPKRFERLRAKLDRGAADSRLVYRFAGSPKRVAKAVLEWLRGEQEPLKQVFNEWEGIGPGRLQAAAGPNVCSTCRVKGETDRISAVVETPAAPRWMAGLLLSHSGKDEYVVAFVVGGRSVVVNRRADGGWETLHRGSCPEPAEPDAFRLEAAREGGAVVFSVEGEEIGRFAAPSRVLGLAIQGGRVRYREVTWE